MRDRYGQIKKKEAKPGRVGERNKWGFSGTREETEGEATVQSCAQQDSWHHRASVKGVWSRTHGCQVLG